MTGDGGEPAGLHSCATPLSQAYDIALLDLDGVIYLGDEVIDHAATALRLARQSGMGLAFVTNNALRTPEEVAARLAGMDIPATRDDVVTSAQAAARVLAERLPPSAPVFVAGGRGLREAVAERGLTVVQSADEQPAGLASGHDPEQTWARLAEATLVLRSGALWVASNDDATFPTSRGLLPGAGAIVALLATASGRQPDVVAGKPHPALHQESMERTSAGRPLVVGDRLDTDIEGAHRAGTDSLLVLTGVTTEADLLAAVGHHRPTYLAADLRGLLEPQPRVEVVGGVARCRAATATWVDGGLTITGEDRLDRLRAACALSWRGRD